MIIFKEIKLNKLQGRLLIDQVKVFEKNYIIENCKYWEVDEEVYINFKYKFDFEKLKGFIAVNNISFQATKLIGSKEQIRAEYHHLIVKS